MVVPVGSSAPPPTETHSMPEWSRAINRLAYFLPFMKIVGSSLCVPRVAWKLRLLEAGRGHAPAAHLAAATLQNEEKRVVPAPSHSQRAAGHTYGIASTHACVLSALF